MEANFVTTIGKPHVSVRRDMRHGSSLIMSVLLAALCCTPKSQEPKARMVCTLMGCTSGVIVRLATMPATTFRVELIPAGGTYGTTYAFDCSEAGRCPQDLLFPGILTESARIRVTTPTGSRETEIPSLVYASFNPNGPRCGPECRQAKVTVPIPE